MIKLVILVLVILVLIYILYKNRKSKKINSSGNSKIREDGIKYADLVGHQNDSITDLLINTLENKEDKTLEDRYNLFRVNLYNRQNLDEARRNLDLIMNHLTDNLPDNIENHIQNQTNNEDVVFHIFNEINQIIAPERLPNIILDNNAQNKRENIDTTHQTERREVSNIYFNETPIHNDPQNVHESEINKFYRDKFELIKEKNLEESPVADLNNLPIYILNMGDEVKRFKAQKTYTSMLSNAPISSLNSSEKIVLEQVWKRINSEENEDKKSQLIVSLLDQLADATEKSLDGKYHTVCTSGKCLRALDSLTLLDADPIISSPPKTKEIVRKEIFETASNYLEKYLDKNPEMSELYNKPEVDLTDSENKKVFKFVEKIKEGFAEKIHGEYENSGVSSEVIDGILVEANVGF